MKILLIAFIWITGMIPASAKEKEKEKNDIHVLARFSTIPYQKTFYHGNYGDWTIFNRYVNNSSLQLTFITGNEIIAGLSHSHYKYNNDYPLTYNGENVYNTPLTHMNELNLHVGKKFDLWKEYITLTAAGGPSLIGIKGPDNVKRVEKCEPGFWGSYCYYTYSYTYKNTFIGGFQARADINLNLTRFIGLSAGGSFSLNEHKSYGGFSLGITAGYLRN